MSAPTNKRRPPPNYFSRGVQMRLLTLVGMFMLVVLLMVEAGKPKNWQWMFGKPSTNDAGAGGPGEGGPPPGVLYSESGYEDRDPDQPHVGDGFPEGGGVGGAVEDAKTGETPRTTSAESPFPDPRPPASGAAAVTRPAIADLRLPDDDPLIRTQVDGWRRAVEQMGRERLRWLLIGLKAVRDGRSLTNEEIGPWNELIAKLQAGWQAYHDDALTSLAEDASGLNARQRDEWLEVLQGSRLRWQDDMLPALAAVGGPTGANEEQRRTLGELQSLLDQVAIGAVEDNTVLRLQEKEAWFRMFECLATTDPQQLTHASTGAVGYLQLYKQPEFYRGKLVTIRGEARMAYRVQAPKNLYGITHYYIFWVKPVGGPSSPLVVYCLETPPGFPPIKDKDQDRATTELHEDVEITGYFFKRWAYRARGGANTAPLLLARSAHWYPDGNPLSGTGQTATAGILALTIGVSLALAGGLTAFVFLRGRGSAAGNWFKHAEQQTPNQLVSLAQQDHPTPIEASLRTLAEHDRRSRRPTDG
jgi:hypothetical protein